MNKKRFLPFLLILLVCAGCDSGDIYPEEDVPTGKSVTAVFLFDHVESFPISDYEVFLGIFDNESLVPISSKNITKPQKNKPVSITLDNIPENASIIRLCLAQAGKKTLYVFYEQVLPEFSGNMLNIPEQEINLLKYDRIQQQVFRQCIVCHGGSSRPAAADLYLIADKSYANLVDIQAERSDKKRVAPLNVQGSFLIDVLTKEDGGLTYTHSTSISSLKSNDIELLQEWIKAGAENE